MKMILERRALIIIGVIIIAGTGIFISYQYFRAPVIQTKEFSGILQSITDNSIFVQGGPSSSDDKIAQDIKIDPENLFTAEIIITADTKIIRTAFRMPTIDELKKTNGEFKPGELPREQSTVGLDALQDDFKITHYIISIRIVSAVNVIGQKKFTAQQIEYTFPIQ